MNVVKKTCESSNQISLWWRPQLEDAPFLGLSLPTTSQPFASQISLAGGGEKGTVSRPGLMTKEIYHMMGTTAVVIKKKPAGRPARPRGHTSTTYYCFFIPLDNDTSLAARQ